MRVGILALLHESNTFISQPTHLEHFEQSWLFEGDQVRTHIGSSHHEVGGFFEGLEAADIEPIGVFAGRATPYGTIRAETFDQLLSRLFAAIEKTLAEHGADINAQDTAGMTSLHFAFHLESFEVFDYLLNTANANPDIEDEDGACVRSECEEMGG